MMVEFLDVIGCTKFQNKTNSYVFAWAEFSTSLLIFARALQQYSANVLPVTVPN